jgi:hypothetical protein
MLSGGLQSDEMVDNLIDQIKDLQERTSILESYPVGADVSIAFLVAAFDAHSSTIAQADYVCDGTADNVEIQAAIDALPSGGGKINLSAGTFNISSTVNGASDVLIDGTGRRATILKWTGGTNDVMFNFEEFRDWGFRQCGFDGDNITGITIIKTGGSTDNTRSRFLTLERLNIENANIGIDFGLNDDNKTDDTSLYDVFFRFCATGIAYPYTTISMFGGSFGASAGNEGTAVILLSDSVATVDLKFWGVTFAAQKYIVDIRDDYDVAAIQFNGCWIEDVSRSIIAKTTGSANKEIRGLVFIECEIGVGSNHNESYPYLDFNNLNVSLMIIGGLIDVAATKTFTVDMDSVTNSFFAVGVKGLDNLQTSGAGSFAYGDVRFNSQTLNWMNYGSSSILSGYTSQVVGHGLSGTPTIINICFREQADNDYGRWWVDNIGASNFTVNVTTNPGASNLDFVWEAKVR